MDSTLLIQTERTILAVAYQWLASKKTQTWFFGIVSTALTWAFAFLFLHLGDSWHLQPALTSLVPLMAGTVSAAIISGMGVALHALGKQDDGKEAAALNLESAKQAGGLGLHEFLMHVEQEAPGIIKKFLDAQDDNAELPPALKLAAVFLKPTEPTPPVAPAA